MPFTPLTQDQYNSAIKSGFSPDQIIANEKTRKANYVEPTTSTTQPQSGGLISGIGSFFSGAAKAVGNVGLGALKETASTLQGIGNLVTKPIFGANAPQGIPQGDLQQQGIAQNIGGVGADIAMLAAQPEVGLEKLGLSGVMKLAETGKLGEAASGIIKSVLTKYGPKAAEVLGDMIQGSAQETVRESGAGQPLDTNKIIGSGIVTGVGGQVIKGIGGKLLGKEAPAVEGELSSAEQKTLGHIQSNEDTMTIGQRKAAIQGGRLEPTKLGGKTFTATNEEQNAAKLLAGKTTGNPVKDVKVIQDEISTRGAAAEKYLSQNPVAVTAADQKKVFDTLQQTSGKYLSKSEMKAYGEQKKIFEQIYNDQAKGKGFNTSTLYSAIKEYENEVGSQLPKGKAAIMDATGIANAKIRAAADIRTAVRQLIGTKNPEFQPQMYDLMSLYGARSTVTTKAEQLSGNVISRALKSKPAKVIGATAGTVGLGYGAYEGIKSIGGTLSQ